MGDPQKPSLCRMVIFKGEDSNGASEHPAVITRVWSDTCVNLTVFFDAKAPESRTSQVLGSNWDWPKRT